MSDLPKYDDLPLADDGGRSGWGVFGDDDNVGLINLLTPDNVVAAARLVRKGAVFAMNAPLDAVSPPVTPRRGLARHRVVHDPGAISFDDVFDNFYPQISSQWDALAHIGYAQNVFYNGATEDDVASGRRNTIEHWAKRGIVGRVVVLDMVRTFKEIGRTYDPGSATGFSVEDLELARERSKITYRDGDVLLLHTGFLEWFTSQSLATRVKTSSGMTSPGLGHSEEICRYVWDAHFSAVVSDNFGVELSPPDRTKPFGFLHPTLIGQFGLALGELWWTHDLATDCAEDGVYEALLASAPLNARGGIGSPANAVVIK